MVQLINLQYNTYAYFSPRLFRAWHNLFVHAQGILILYQAYCLVKKWQMQSEDEPHLVACLPRLKPFTEDCVYRRSSSTLLL